MRSRSFVWLELATLLAACSGDHPTSGTSPASRSARCTSERVVEEFWYSEGKPPTPEFFHPRIETRRDGPDTIRITYLIGPDNRWLTDDDQIHEYTRTRETGELLEAFTIDAAGPDGQWLSADDVARTHELWCRQGSASRRTGSLTLVGPGPDGRPCTGDDEIRSANAYHYDAAGVLARYISIDGPGDDARWLTDDDRISSWAAYEFESDGAPHSAKVALTPGPDGVWLTADDPLRVSATFTYKGNDESDQHMGDGGIYRYCIRPKFQP